MAEELSNDDIKRLREEIKRALEQIAFDHSVSTKFVQREANYVVNMMLE